MELNREMTVSFDLAVCRLYRACMFNQCSAGVPNAASIKMAKSAVMDLFPFKISFSIVYDTAMAFANSFCVIPLDSSSSFNISPG